jgi:hypothetical protein
MELSRKAREQFRRFGSEGGKARAARLTASERKAIARYGAYLEQVASFADALRSKPIHDHAS